MSEVEALKTAENALKAIIEGSCKLRGRQSANKNLFKA